MSASFQGWFVQSKDFQSIMAFPEIPLLHRISHEKTVRNDTWPSDLSQSLRPLCLCICAELWAYGYSTFQEFFVAPLYAIYINLLQSWLLECSPTTETCSNSAPTTAERYFVAVWSERSLQHSLKELETCKETWIQSGPNFRPSGNSGNNQSAALWNRSHLWKKAVLL